MTNYVYYKSDEVRDYLLELFNFCKFQVKSHRNKRSDLAVFINNVKLLKLDDWRIGNLIKKGTPISKNLLVAESEEEK